MSNPEVLDYLKKMLAALEAEASECRTRLAKVEEEIQKVSKRIEDERKRISDETDCIIW